LDKAEQIGKALRHSLLKVHRSLPPRAYNTPREGFIVDNILNALGRIGKQQYHVEKNNRGSVLEQVFCGYHPHYRKLQ